MDIIELNYNEVNTVSGGFVLQAIGFTLGTIFASNLLVSQDDRLSLDKGSKMSSFMGSAIGVGNHFYAIVASKKHMPRYIVLGSTVFICTTIGWNVGLLLDYALGLK